MTPDAFWAMADRDPDIKPTEPTDDDLREFEEWAVGLFGRETYEEYMLRGEHDD